MKAICEGVDLSEAVVKVIKACPAKTVKPILECIKITAKNDTLILTATDSEMAIIKKIKAEILEEGEICVPGKFFADFIGKLSGVQILLNVIGNKMEILYEESRTDMQVLSSLEFPKVDTDIKEKSFKVRICDLKKYIKSTSFCCSVDEARPILKGCQFLIRGNDVSITSIDGFRLATIKGKIISATEDMEIVCPAKTLDEIEKMLPDIEDETEIFVQKGIILVSYNNTILTSRLYNGDFMNKDNIIPKSFITYTIVDKNLLKSSIERAAVLVRGDKNSLIILNITANKIEISSNSELGNMQEPIKAEVFGKDLKIAMNSKFIIEVINAFEEEKIKISFNNSNQPFICENESNKERLYLILPVRTVNNA